MFHLSIATSTGAVLGLKNKKHSYRRETALASKQGKGKTVGSRTVEGSEKKQICCECA
jgi:hypothetical protein